MSDIDLSEAVEAATDAVITVRDAHPRVATDADSYDVAEAAVKAALPHIERQVREQVAREIEAAAQKRIGEHTSPFIAGMVTAARLARGDS